MSAKSKKSAAAIDRPFDRHVLERARAIAEQYQVILEFEDGEWYGHGLELPRIFADGKTPNECVKQVREAMTGAVALMMEQGQAVPSPAREARRTEQVNIRLTAEEKIRIESTARRKGFKGLSDYVRRLALDESLAGKE